MHVEQGKYKSWDQFTKYPIQEDPVIVEYQKTVAVMNYILMVITNIKEKATQQSLYIVEISINPEKYSKLELWIGLLQKS